MPLRDLLRLAAGAVASNRLRSLLSMLGIAIGIAAVMLLTSIGEGTRRYIIDQFTQFGTNIIAINPGKTETAGIPGVLGGTTHKLTIDDAEALARVPGIERVLAVTIGQARVEAQGRGRSVFVYGVTPEVLPVWKVRVAQGTFIPAGDPRRGAPVAVLGSGLKRELYGDDNALGTFVHIGGTRFRVIGVMAPKGKLLGFDIDDTAYLPVRTAMRLFNRDELFEIDLIFSHAGLTEEVVERARRILTDRHDGREDFTLTTQAEMLKVFANVMNVVTLAVGAIAGISLLVGAVGILTIMWIAVRERTSEIGLLRALGASAEQVLGLFLAEAAALSLAGGALGIAAGIAIGTLLKLVVPGLPVHTPPQFVVAALLTSLATGLASGVLPARQAAAVDPIEALRSE